MYSMALGPRKGKVLSLSGPKALLFLWLLISLHTRSVVNVCAISKDFLFVSLVTNRVSPAEVCLSRFDMLSRAASCLDDKKEIPLKVIASFSPINSFNASQQLGDMCLLVQGLNKISPFSLCVRRYGSGCHNSVLAVQARWDLIFGGHLVLSSYPIYLLVHVPRRVYVQ